MKYYFNYGMIVFALAIAVAHIINGTYIGLVACAAVIAISLHQIHRRYGGTR